MPLVTAALGHNVDHAAGRAAEFGFETRALDLHFLHEREGQVVVLTQHAGTEVGHFLTVDDERVLRTGSTVHLEATVERLGTGRRSNLQQAGEVGGLRQQLSSSCCDVRLDFIVCGIDRQLVSGRDIY
jgi:hypothetical protein